MRSRFPGLDFLLSLGVCALTLTLAPGPVLARIGTHQQHHHRHHYPAQALPTGSAVRGKRAFQRLNCSKCHAVAPHAKSSGPNLYGLFNPSIHGHVMTVGDVEHQIIHGGGGMPPYGDVVGKRQLADLVAYLHTLGPPPDSSRQRPHASAKSAR